MVLPYAVYYIGGQPENLLDFVHILKEKLVRTEIMQRDFGFQAHEEPVVMQPGDVPVTYADAIAMEQDCDFRPRIDLRTGLRRFVEWYRGNMLGK